MAKDHTTKATPRGEVGMQFHYRIFDRLPFSVYFTAGALWQTYYPEYPPQVQFWSLSSGLNFVLR